MLFKMSKVDFIIIKEVSKMGCSSTQENINRAWEALGEKMGFDWTTVTPSNKGDRYFTADNIIK